MKKAAAAAAVTQDKEHLDRSEQRSHHWEEGSHHLEQGSHHPDSEKEQASTHRRLQANDDEDLQPHDHDELPELLPHNPDGDSSDEEEDDNYVHNSHEDEEDYNLEAASMEGGEISQLETKSAEATQLIQRAVNRYLLLDIPAVRKRQGSPLSVKPSYVWKHFTKVGVNTVCNICKHKYTHVQGTSNMRGHLKKKHKIVDDEKSDQSKLDFAVAAEQESKTKRAPMIKVWKEAIDEALSNMVIGAKVSFHFIENKWFRQFVQLLNPDYSPPCHQTVSKDVVSCYKKCVQ